MKEEQSTRSSVDIDWHHVSTGVVYVVFFIDLSTGLVSCNIKLKTMNMMETSGIRYTAGGYGGDGRRLD